CKINTADKANRNTNQTCKRQQFGASQNCIGKSTARFANGGRQLCKEVPVQRSSALPHEVTQYEEKNGYGNQRANGSDCKHHEVRGLPADGMRDHECAVAFLV